ncbi:hypothetical protein [Streptomyces sp. NPDC021012]|uniref:hypothetical protein n=1 Tax=unclassified Streptomyces TaxID=2593676 RepID=UPI0037BA58F8
MMTGAGEELAADVPFLLPDGLAVSRRGDVEPFGRPAEAQLLAGRHTGWSA